MAIDAGGAGGGSTKKTGASVIKKPVKLPTPKVKYSPPKKTTAATQKKQITTAAKKKTAGTKPGVSFGPRPKKVTLPKPAIKPDNKSAWQKKKEIEDAAKKKTAQSKPGPTTLKKPATKTATTTKKPATPAKKPTTSTKKPTTSTKKPAATTKKPATPAKKPTTSTAKPKTDAAMLASTQKLNELWKQATGYKDQIDALMKGGFSYDPEKDAQYKALQTLAQKQAGTASTAAMEDMNDRGILNSTVTSDRLGQIQQTAQDAVTAQIPGLQQQAYGMYMDKLGSLNDLWNSTVAMAQQERAFGEDKRRWDLGYKLDVDQFNTSKDQWNKTFDYNAAQDSIQNQIKNDQVEVSRANSDLDYMRWAQDSAGINNKQSTQAAISELLGFKSAGDAEKHLSNNANKYFNSGVNLTDVLTALGKRWPGFGSTPKPAAGGSKPTFK